MKKITIFFAVASVLMLAQVNSHALEGFATVVSADPGPEPDGTIGDFLDLNDDQRISYDEFVHSMAVKAMREMDADRDDFLTREEAAALGAKAHPDIAPIEFSKADANGNGRVSIEELEETIRGHAGANELFQKHDEDGNGSLGKSEVESIQVLPLIRFHF